MTWNLCRIEFSCPFCVAGVGGSNYPPASNLINREGISRENLTRIMLTKSRGKGFAVRRLNEHDFCPALNLPTFGYILFIIHKLVGKYSRHTWIPFGSVKCHH